MDNLSFNTSKFWGRLIGRKTVQNIDSQKRRLLNLENEQSFKKWDFIFKIEFQKWP